MRKRKNNIVIPSEAEGSSPYHLPKILRLRVNFLKIGTPLRMTILVFFLTPLIAQATDKAPSSYSPENCEFSVTFPSEPYTTQRCDPENEDECYDQVSYTQTDGIDSTVNFRVICNPIDQKVYDYYTEEVMKATLRAMTKRSVVKTFDTSYRGEDGYKQAGLVGEGKSGALETIYLAQLWIGKHSAFSVEAEMIGNQNDKADKLFSDVLKSVHFVDKSKKQPATDKEKPEEKDKKETKPEEEKKKEGKE